MYFKKDLSKRVLASVAALAITATTLMSGDFLKTPENVVQAAGSDNYAKLLQQSLFFYDANMCGTTVKSNSLLTWRDNCHTSDEVAGGYHDAGDHAMFGLPQGFSASTLGWGYYEFKDAYDSVGVTGHFKTVMNHFTEFFKASTKLDSSGNVTSFLYQKGDGNVDHAYWGPPENQGGSRRMYWTSNGASDIAAEYAAALALNYLNFGNEEDLKYAKALYSFSTRSNSVATEGTGGFYDSKSCRDEQAWAAGWLYLATKQESYKSDCASKQDEYLGWVHGWENVGLGAACVYAHITGDWNKVNSFIGGKANGSGYFFLDKWGSARLNTSMQFTALVAQKNSGANYASWCKGQMDYILGNNPANTCFVVGFASNSASKPHHRACSGTSTAEDESPSKYVLVGALVGGPSDAGGTYRDSRADYVCNEVAVDYNAGFVGAAAGLYSVYKTGSVESTIVGAKSNGIGGGSSDPTTTTTTKTTTSPNTNTTTKSTTSASSSDGTYTIKPDKEIVYSKLPADDKMIGFAYEDFGIKAGEKVTKVEVNISSSSNIGKWQGAFGSSTTVDPEYWTQTADMSQTISGNKGTITWNVSSADSKIIQTQYGGEVKFGVWWIDCGTFNIDSITITTDASSSSTTTKTTTASTTKATTKATTAAPSSDGTYTIKPDKEIVYSKLPADDKMIGFAYEDFGIKAGEKVTKVEVNISSSSNIGKWQGAFGSSTTVDPEYWTQTADMSQTISGNKGTITWNVSSADSKIIQTQYGGEVKFGVWWIDCGTFNIDSITITTDGGGTTTTTKTTTATTKATTKTTTSSSSNTRGDVNGDGIVTSVDVVTMLQAVVGKVQLDSQSRSNADLNNDGKISIIDVIKLKNLLLG